MDREADGTRVRAPEPSLSSNFRDFPRLRVAIVHHWFVARRGGERVMEALAELFPQAHFFTLVLDRNALAPVLQSHKFTVSFLQKLPGATRHYRKMLPLFPLALEQFRLDDYDLVISSESGPTKGVLTRPETCHICYCNTPMRYIWDAYHRYRGSAGAISRTVFSLSAHYLRMWDLATAFRVDYFIANSQNVAARIRKRYRRESTVIHPPVMVSGPRTSRVIEDYYLTVGQLVDYKRVDLAIGACNHLGRRLRIIGDGEQYRQLRRLSGPTIEFLGSLSDDAVYDHYSRCRALLFPGEEDFGIVPVEAQSFGRPVIAYGRGGVLETVRGFFADEPFPSRHASGVFFREQAVPSLVDAIKVFESTESRFDPEMIREQVQRFSVERFKADMTDFILEKLREHSADSVLRRERQAEPLVASKAGEE